MDVLAWDFGASDFVRNLDYLDAVLEPSRDVQELTAVEFDALVAKTRALRSRRPQ